MGNKCETDHKGRETQAEVSREAAQIARSLLAEAEAALTAPLTTRYYLEFVCLGFESGWETVSGALALSLFGRTTEHVLESHT